MDDGVWVLVRERVFVGGRMVVCRSVISPLWCVSVQDQFNQVKHTQI